MHSWEASIEELKSIVEARKEIGDALTHSIRKAGMPDVASLDDFYKFLSTILGEIPIRAEMSNKASKLHYLIGQSPGDILKKDSTFHNWLRGFFQSFGAFMDTTDSAKELDSFIKDPSYNIDDYDRGPGGWFTFNQFFTRHVKPGKRPVDAICDNKIIVSPCDGVYKGCWRIDDNSAVTAKDTDYSIIDLLEGSAYKDRFSGGIFTHSYLDTNDYHRYHTPVGGVVKEVRKIPGDVMVKTIRDESGELKTISDVGFQFRQTRGLVILESEIGLVALLPIGMGHVSSVNLTVEPGISLVKGEEFGYFAYGGSDMVMLFQDGRLQFMAEPCTHYKQGKRIAYY
jgi:phosphatidylserine decarboxylase precursor